MKNGISIAALSEFAHEVRGAPAEGRAAYGVTLDWEAGTRATARADGMRIGTHRVARSFSWTVDEPRQLLGSNHAASPQEYLLSGLGGCILVSFLAGATTRGVRLESLDVTVEGEIDLRGFLGLAGDAEAAPTDRPPAEAAPADGAPAGPPEPGAVPTGFEGIRYSIRARGDAEPAVMEEIHREALLHSPNAATIRRPVALTGTLDYEREAVGAG